MVLLTFNFQYMISNNTGKCLAAAMLLSPALMMAQDAKTLPQNYTSSIEKTQAAGLGVVQQVASPFSVPVLESGDDIVRQGLFAILTGVTDSMTGVGSIVVEDGAVSIEYDAMLKTLVTTCPEAGRLMVVNANGQTVLSKSLQAGATGTDISSLAPGMYIAGYTSNNKINKSLKFIVK